MSHGIEFDAAKFGMAPDTVVTQLGGGRNSRVFLLEEPGEQPFVCKRYFVSPDDTRDRQGTEAKALAFFEKMGVENVPRLLGVDTALHASFISYIDGERICEPSLHDVQCVGDFLVKLIHFSESEEARSVGFRPASEAFFSASKIIANIDTRLERLTSLDLATPAYTQLKVFLEESLLPGYASFSSLLSKTFESEGMLEGMAIPSGWRILSPSDVGTHNAIRLQDGSLSFFDFEYLGWDDPSKMLADFCLHPAMDLSESQQGVFLKILVPALDSIGFVRSRAKALFPLFGIKWCCILLNEFVPCEAARRSHAEGGEVEDKEPVLRRQLSKAQKLLNSLEERTEIFSRQLDKA